MDIEKGTAPRRNRPFMVLLFLLAGTAVAFALTAALALGSLSGNVAHIGNRCARVVLLS